MSFTADEQSTIETIIEARLEPVRRQIRAVDNKPTVSMSEAGELAERVTGVLRREVALTFGEFTMRLSKVQELSAKVDQVMQQVATVHIDFLKKIEEATRNEVGAARDKLREEMLSAVRSATAESARSIAESTRSLDGRVNDIKKTIDGFASELARASTREFVSTWKVTEIATQIANDVLNAYKAELHQLELERIQREIERGAAGGGGGGGD